MDELNALILAAGEAQATANMREDRNILEHEHQFHCGTEREFLAAERLRESADRLALLKRARRFAS